MASFIGACAWAAPWVYTKFARPIIHARLIGCTETSGTYNSTNCLQYFLTINIVSLKNYFNLKDISVTITFDDTGKELTGSLFWAREIVWVFGSNVKSDRRRLNIMPEDTIPFVGTFPQNMTKKVYLLFRVDKAARANWQEIRLSFVEHSGREQAIRFSRSSINEDQMVYDDRIWVNVSPTTGG